MDNWGVVSIVTPTYNCAEFISETIKSVLAQTYPYWELLVVDDYSEDNTVAIVKEWCVKDTRIKYECNPENSGAAIARNNALRRAQGKWIAFLDSDDLWTSDKLEKQIKFMVDNNYHFSYTGYCEMDEQGHDIGVFVTGPKHVTLAGMYAFCWPGCLTVMYDRNYVGLIQIKDIKKNNDYAMWLKICHKTDCYLLNESLAKYRRGRSGSVSNHGILTMIKWHYKLFHDAEGMNPVCSFLHTLINLAFGFYKKMKYVKHL